MKYKILSFLIIFLGYISSPALGRNHLPLDGFSQAIGGPNEAFSSGAADIFINPALMSSIPDRQIQFSNLINGHDLQYFSTALVWKAGKNKFLGLGIFGLDVPVSEVFNGTSSDLRYNNTYYFNINLSYAYNFNNFTLGTSMEYISSQIYPDNAYQRENILQADIGIYTKISQNIKLGFTINHAWDISGVDLFSIFNQSRIGGSIVWMPFAEYGDRIQLLLSLEKYSGQKRHFKYGIIVKPFSIRQLNMWGIKNIAFRGGTADNNIGYLNIPGKSSYFFKENNNLIGLDVRLKPIYHIELGINYCYQFNELPRNLTLLTTRITF